MNGDKLSVILFLLCLLGPSWEAEQFPKVKTLSGDISGYYKNSHNGRKYEAYEGIPYAQPPVGKLRFEPPKPTRKWASELPARKKGSICTQYLMSDKDGDRVTGCEDCLYLNVYLPVRNSSDTLLPVMFWIHGGAYQFGSGNEAFEGFLMDRDVVFVSVNYRLGPFGFLSTGDQVVSGNMGLKDQSVALRWVSNNIKYFGGNPKDITTFGVSAGGASVHYHYMSPMSTGLFQRGISLSGVALDPWPQTDRAPQKAKELGALMGCPTNSSSRMISCLKDRPARLLSQAVGDFMYWLYNPFTPFGPVVEKQASRPFIDKSPIEIISKGGAQDIPWISGVVSEEGLYPAAQFVDNEGLLKELNDNWDNIAPYLLDFNDTVPLNQHKQLAEKIRKHYLGSKKINSRTVMPLIHMIGDRMFAVDFEKATRLQAKVNTSPVWTYYYSYRATHSLTEILGGTNKNFGVSHTDDIFLILNEVISNTTNPMDMEMQQLLINFYTSFAIHGVPLFGNAKWQPLKPDEKAFQYLYIANSSNIAMKRNDNFAQKKFWNSINFNENKLSPR